MRIFIVDTFYGPYLERLYAGGALTQQPWTVQHKAHFAGGFGTGDAYSHGLGLLGVEAIEIVANSTPLQQAWAREHQPALLQLLQGAQQLFAILEAQIRWWQPTVLYVQDINWLPAAFLQHVKPLVEMVVGQNACPLVPGLDLSPYDLLLTSLPHYVGRFRDQGVKAAYFPIGFDERLLQRHRTEGPRPHALTFVGGLGGYHSQGTQMLEAIARELPLQVWGYGGEQLPMDSTLRQRWRGEAWADDMYGLLASSQITLNRHIDIAEGYANNMRLYEATGMGACLLTDYKLNIYEYFEPDYEVVTYLDSFEAIDKIRWLSQNPKAAVEIGKRGQERTLLHHTYTDRMKKLKSLLLTNLKKYSKKANHFLSADCLTKSDILSSESDIETNKYGINIEEELKPILIIQDNISMRRIPRWVLLNPEEATMISLIYRDAFPEERPNEPEEMLGRSKTLNSLYDKANTIQTIIQGSGGFAEIDENISSEKPEYLKQFRDKESCLNLGGGQVESRDNWHVLDALGGHYFSDDYMIPYADKSIDFIYSSMLFEHLTESEVAHLLAECSRALKKNGKMRIVVPNNLLYIKRYILNDAIFFENMVGIYSECWSRFGIAKTIETMLVAAISSVENRDVVCKPGSTRIIYEDGYVITPFPPHRYLLDYYCGPPPEIADSNLIAENLFRSLSCNYTDFMDWIFLASRETKFAQNLRFNSCHKSWWDKNKLVSILQANKIKIKAIRSSKFGHGLGCGLAGDIEKEDHSPIGAYIDILLE